MATLLSSCGRLGRRFFQSHQTSFLISKPFKSYERTYCTAAPFRGDYSKKGADDRRRWAEDMTKTSLCNLDGWWEPHAPFDEEHLIANIENAIGVIRIPVGVVGPIQISGKHAKGSFLVPASTLEGTLLASANRGSRALNKSGGVEVDAFRQRMLRTPTVICEDSEQSELLGEWIDKSVPHLHDVVATVSRRALLKSVISFRDAEKLNLFFSYDTQEAAGQNMTTTCTSACCKWIMGQIKEELPEVKVKWIIGENSLSGDKRMSSVNALFGRGVSAISKASIPEDIVKSVFKVDSDTLVEGYDIFSDFAHRGGSPSSYVGNVPNMVAAIFAATGQDLGSVAESSQAFLSVKKGKGEDGGLDVKLNMPNLAVGTVGGGTSLPTQIQCLEMMGCTGPKSSFKLAEIIASVCLAAELSLLSSVLSGTHADAHDKLGRNRPVSYIY